MPPVASMKAARRDVSAAIETSLIDASLHIPRAIGIATIPVAGVMTVVTTVVMSVVAIVAAIMPTAVAMIVAIVTPIILSAVIAVVLSSAIAPIAIVGLHRQAPRQQRHCHGSSEQGFHRSSPR
jgi:hypothetical protein